MELCNNDPKLAFSPDGVEKMNANIQALNNGVPHKPIYKVRTYEKSDKKFAIGQIGSKNKKFVEAADGTNLFYIVYSERMEDGIEKRSFVTAPFKVALDCQKRGKKEWRTLLDQWMRDQKLVTENSKLSFILSPGDLVYVPTVEELQSKQYSLLRNRIYKLVSTNDANAYFIPCSVASPIVDNTEYTQLNKIPRLDTGELIREICIPVKVDRLGNIIVQ